MEKPKSFGLSRLTNGAHVTFHEETHASMAFMSLIESLKAKLIDYKTAINNEKSLLNLQMGSTYTDDLREADQKSDNAVGTLMRVIDAYTTSPDMELRKVASDLKVIVKPYRGVGRHEMMKQSAEISKLTEVLTSEPAATMVGKLFLTPALQQVIEANNLVIEINKNRDKETEEIMPETKLKSLELRKITDEFYQEAIDIAYAYSLIGGEADRALAAQFISALNVRIDHYKDILTHNTSSKQK